MSHIHKGFTLFEIVIVLSLIGLFIVALGYYTSDSRTNQYNANRLADTIINIIRNTQSNMVLGRTVSSGSTQVTTEQRVISITGSGITTIYGTTSTGTETSLVWPFYDNDKNYQITDISVSSGILLNGHMPVWDRTGVTNASITVFSAGNLQISAIGVTTPINIIRITAGYQGSERSVMLDRVIGKTELVTGKGESTYIPAPTSPPIPSCAANPSFPNRGTLTIGTPVTPSQGWIYSAVPGNCTYDCIVGYMGANCLTPPANTCDTNPSYLNIGILTTGVPSSVGQAWFYSAVPGNCTYDCINGYTGNGCLTPPAPVTGFTTTWKVGTVGYGNGDKIVRFTVVRTAGAMIDWGDGTVESLITTTPSHLYLSSGDYTIRMSGITRFYSYNFNTSYAGKLTAVNDWGGVIWTNMSNMFAYANHLNQLPVGAPDMSSVASTAQMFYGASLFNQSVTNFNTSSVLNMSYMFDSATSFDQDLSSWIVNPNVVSCTQFSTNTPAWILMKPTFSNCIP